MLFTGFDWSPEPKFLRSPVGVVVLDKPADGYAYFLELLEDPVVDP